MKTDPYPGRVFVATIDCYPSKTIEGRIKKLLGLMVDAGFAATCPGWSVMSGILVPMAQADAARKFLSQLSLNWITGWVCTEDDSQSKQFGCFEKGA